MLTVGLTGGIGSGKSAVADLLEEFGAVLIDADRIAREVVEPGGPAYQPLVDRFGPAIVDGEGRIDRPALAAIVFPDPAALADLNAITHPAIGAEMARRKEAAAGTDKVVVLDIPLLTAAHRQTMSLDSVVVVDTPVKTALARLVEPAGDEQGGRRSPDGGPGLPGGAPFRGRPGDGQFQGPRAPPERGGAGLGGPHVLAP